MHTSNTFRSAFPAGTITPQAILDFHRATFGDLRMEDDDKDDKGDGDKTDDDKGKPGDPANLGDAGKRALQAERDARTAEKKRADTAEAKLADIEKSQMTEQQRIEKERDDAKSAASGATMKLGQYEAAAEAGLPLSWAKRVTGDTPAERLADAKAMAADLAAKANGGKPKPDPSQGKGAGDGARASSVQQARDDYLASRQKK